MKQFNVLDKNVKTSDKPATGVWLKRIGIAGFTFFLVKGLFWIAIMLGMVNVF